MRHIALSEPCVWMAAGLLSYKLCDRDFDCTRCALDAALRGAHGTRDPAPGTIEARRGHGFPDDRRYAPGHTWMAGVNHKPGPEDPGLRESDVLVRLGLDGFAAQLLPQPVRVLPTGAHELARGDVLCDLELPEGMLAIYSSIAARVVRDNPALRKRPSLVVESPYDEGWLLELEPVWDTASRESLIDADRARQRGDAHVRHFRRRVALHLLSANPATEPCMADGGEPLTSLSEILGGLQYLRILREVLR
jgi:glycine cleavage system H protein